jgi:thiol-disulfide isomerase/thioredoxin
MKNIFLILLLASFSLQAQYKIKGELSSPEKYTWVILYKIENARQLFIKNESLKKVSKVIDGEKTAIGQFEFILPANAEVGTYRVSYKTAENAFVDFLFNKEDVAFTFDPEKAEETIQFQKSKENKLYRNYMNSVSIAQYKIDSLQIAYIQDPEPEIAPLYYKQLKEIAALQEDYLVKSKGLMAYHFIKATNKYNSPIIAKDLQEYSKYMNNHFFDAIDFNNSVLYNSPFIIDRIADYVLYMNYSDDPEKQNEFYKTGLKTVLEKVKNETFKKNIIEFLITQFVDSKNIDFADQMMKIDYQKLSDSIQNKKFISDFNKKTRIAIGRDAPEITWKENDKEYKLSTINDAQNYLLVFWSTGCSHCLREIPILYTYTQNSKNTKVIAFSLEKNDKDWTRHIEKYPEWHHVLGLKRWRNSIARTYQIRSTPTYIMLDKDKKIIDKPDTLEEVKKLIEQLDEK